MYPLDLSVAAGAPAIAVFEFGNPNGDQKGVRTIVSRRFLDFGVRWECPTQKLCTSGSGGNGQIQRIH